MAEKKWEGKTYGNGWMHKWLIRMLKVVDVRILYGFTSVFVIPFCVVFNKSGKVNYRFYRKGFGLSPWKAFWQTYRNHCQFGQVVIDRFAMYAGKHFEVDLEGFDHYLALSRGQDSFVQLSAHIGNYELAGYTLVAENKPFNALVFGGEKASIMAHRDTLFSNTHIKMIAVKADMSHLFEIDHALNEGETVSMPADRIWGSPKYVVHPFLGHSARFPLGPFSVATLRGSAVLAVNVMKTGARRYKIHITPLDYDKRENRREQIRQLSLNYVKELERIVRDYPTQWYNYYEFWEHE